MDANSLAQCWAQSSTQEVGILSVTSRGYFNLQTGSSGLGMLRK